MRVSVGLATGMEGMMYPVPFATPEDLVSIACRAEELGYHSVWGNDHMTTQHYVREEFPTPPNFWEILITYAYIAARTTTLRLGTAMLVLPMRRDIVVTAKQIATLDHFSGGRMELGVGIGAYREEFQALNPEWQVHRGDMVEEGIRALQMLFTQRNASFDGKYYKFSDVEMYPKPLQSSLPVYVGGNNPNAIRRTVEMADGWLPACLPVDQLRASVVRLRELAGSHGRDPAGIEVAPQYVVYVGRTREEAVARFRESQMYNHLSSLAQSTLKDQAGVSQEEVNLVGSVDDVIEKAQRLREAGATHLLGLYFAVNSVPELMDQMALFAEDVVPRI